MPTLRKIAAKNPIWHAIQLIATAMFVVGLYNFFGAFGINTSQPHPETGRIYKLNNHGTFAYVTRQEYWRSEGFLVGGLAVNFAVVMLRLRLSNSER